MRQGGLDSPGIRARLGATMSRPRISQLLKQTRLRTDLGLQSLGVALSAPDERPYDEASLGGWLACDDDDGAAIDADDADADADAAAACSRDGGESDASLPSGLEQDTEAATPAERRGKRRRRQACRRPAREPEESAPGSAAAAASSSSSSSSSSSRLQSYFEEAGASELKPGSSNLRTLREYSRFSVEAAATQSDGGGRAGPRLTATPGGDISPEEAVARAFLARLRFGGGPTEGPYVLKAKTLENRFTLLKAALRQCLATTGELPSWAVSGCKTSHHVDKMFQQWRRKEQGNEAASVRRGFITDEHVEAYCLRLMAQDAVEARLAPRAVCAALLLRVQSARSIRHGNLATMRWADVGWEAAAAEGVPDVGSLSVVVTKNLGSMSARRAVVSRLKSKLLAADEISGWFFRRWWEDSGAAAGERGPDDYFFPSNSSTGGVDFSKPMTNEQHNQLCRSAAEALRLATTKEELSTFTSTCVRRGCAAALVGELQAVMRASNHRLGRAATSSIDLSTYAPEEVVLQPGPLFDDVDGIASRVQEYFALHAGPRVAALTCPVCGYPRCSCVRCDHLRKGIRTSTRSHVCWMAGQLGRISRAGPRETEAQRAARTAAWLALGFDAEEVPFWTGNAFGWAMTPAADALPANGGNDEQDHDQPSGGEAHGTPNSHRGERPARSRRTRSPPGGGQEGQEGQESQDM